MTQLGFYFDAEKCNGCKTCTVACKDAHNLPVGLNFRKVLEYTGGAWRQDRATGAWHQNVFAYNVSVSCNHCADPACTKVCPTHAHHKRAEDGLVVIDREKCIGCGMCATACPYGAPQLDKAARKMVKCDGCADRLALGAQPICVEACTQRALEFGDIAALRKKYGENASIAPLPAPEKTKPCLVVGLPKTGAKPSGDTSGKTFTH